MGAVSLLASFWPVEEQTPRVASCSVQNEAAYGYPIGMGLESINVKVLVGVNIVCACLFIRRKSKAVCMENQDILA